MKARFSRGSTEPEERGPDAPDLRWVSRSVEWGLQGLLQCQCWGVVVKVEYSLSVRGIIFAFPSCESGRDRQGLSTASLHVSISVAVRLESSFLKCRGTAKVKTIWSHGKTLVMGWPMYPGARPHGRVPLGNSPWLSPPNDHFHR